MLDYMKLIYISKVLKEDVPKNTFFLGESFFEFSKMDIYKCPKMRISKFNLGKIQLYDHN